MNLANKLTVFRIILVPVFMVLLLKEYYIAAAVVFILASITDALDGYIARSRNLITKLGKFLDPLADKILVTSALVCFVELGNIPAWMVVVIVAREYIVSILRAIAASEGKVIAASKWGKLKTIFQMLAIISFLLDTYLYRFIDFPMSLTLIWIALILTIASGIDYVYKNRSVFSGQK